MRELNESIIPLEQVPAEGLAFQGGIPPRRLERLREATAGLPEIVAVDLRLEPHNDVYLLRGRITGHAVLQCEYCRAHFDHPLAAELFLTVEPDPEREVQPDPAQKGEVWVLTQSDNQVEAPGGRLDLVGALEDEWLLGLPQSPICDPACRGLCPVCGADRNEAECGCPRPQRENPFAILAQLKQDS